MRSIVITGVGVNCAHAVRKEDFSRRLFSSSSLPEPKEPSQNLNLEIRVFQAPTDACSPIQDSRFDHATGRFCASAAKESLADYQKRGGKNLPDALILGTSTGGQSECEDFYFQWLNGTVNPHFSFTSKGIMASSSRAVASELDFQGRIYTLSTACTSSANAIAFAAALIESGRSECVLAGGGDALCATTLSGFSTLRLTGPQQAKPFGIDRPGLTLGEGAAFLILEPKEKVIQENRPYYAELAGYAMGSDAFHMTAPSENGEGALRVMEDALKKAGMTPDQIDFINAHGTGTLLNDRTEAQAIAALFSKTPVASIKGLTGHTLGGAGAIEAVASLLCLEEQRGFANFNSPEASPDCPVVLSGPQGVLLPKEAVILSNSFAFGGNNCTLIFKGGGK